MRNSIHTFLDDCLGRGEETAFAEQHGLRVVRRTYAELANTAYRFARELESRGINKGDRVLVWAENSAEWVSAFFGCALRGVVVVPLDEQSASDFVERVQQQVSAKLLLCGQGQQQSFAKQLPTLRLDELDETIAHHSGAAFQPDNIAQDDLLEIIFTSGTTAEPKGVCLTHRNLLANLNTLEKEIQKYLWMERSFHPLRFLCLLPLSHVFGQFMGVFVPLLLGGEVFFSHSQKPADIIATIKRERISVAAAVPRQLETLREKIERDFAASGKLDDFRRRFDEADGKHFAMRWWRFRDVHRLFGWKFMAFVSGGATLDEQTENFWQRLSFAVVQGYGMTETASLVSVNHPFKASRGSIGKTLPGQQVKLGEGGEILVRGENVAAGYWRDGVQKMPDGEGWLKTGDVAALDESGNLFFKGRQKDVIVTSAGLNIYPDDLELALTHQPEVRAACVIAVEGAQGPEPMAALILRDDKNDPAEIVQRANNRLNSSQQIRRWFVWPEADFPRTATQKVRKPLIKDFITHQGTGRYGTGSDSDGVGSDAHARVGSLAALAAKLGAEDLSKLDSLGRVALLSAIEDRYQIELDEAALTPDTKLSDLEKMISAGNHTRADKSESAIEYPYPRWALRWPIT